MHLAQRQTEHLMGGGPTSEAPARPWSMQPAAGSTAALRVLYPFLGWSTLSRPATSVLEHELERNMNMRTPGWWANGASRLGW